MMQKLSDSIVADWVLVIDLLGFAERMSNEDEWLVPLNELLKVISTATAETVNVTEPDHSIPLFQFGDSVVICGNEPQRLIQIGKSMLLGLFHKNILAQVALSGRKAYFINSERGFGAASARHPNAFYQCLVGPGAARVHLALRGKKGPRFVVDVISRPPVPAEHVWSWYTGDEPPRKKEQESVRKERSNVPLMEIQWWDDLVSPEDIVKDRINSIIYEIKNLRAERDKDFASMANRVDADISSLEKRREHWEAFSFLLRQSTQK